MSSHIFDLSFRVLFYEEDGQCVAHALELDLVGVGDSWEEAEKELDEAIACQVSFAAQHDEQSLIALRAPQELFERWEKAQMEAMQALWSKREKCEQWEVRAAVMQVNPKAVRKASRRRFEPKELCLA